MTKRQLRRLQCRARRGVNRLYHGYLAGVLRGMESRDRALVGVLASLPAPRSRSRVSATEPKSHMVYRELKRRGDLGCARVREQLWQLQHLHIGPSPAGE